LRKGTKTIIMELKIYLNKKLHCIIPDDAYAQDIINAVKKVYREQEITIEKISKEKKNV